MRMVTVCLALAWSHACWAQLGQDPTNSLGTPKSAYEYSVLQEKYPIVPLEGRASLYAPDERLRQPEREGTDATKAWNAVRSFVFDKTLSVLEHGGREGKAVYWGGKLLTGEVSALELANAVLKLSEAPLWGISVFFDSSEIADDYKYFGHGLKPLPPTPNVPRPPRGYVEPFEIQALRERELERSEVERLERFETYGRTAGINFLPKALVATTLTEK
jgi:hypothetical protein